MIKRLAIKILIALLSLALGFLLCLFTVKSEKQEWTELEATRLEQVERLSRMMERVNEECSEMDEYNEEAVIIEPETINNRR